MWNFLEGLDLAEKCIPFVLPALHFSFLPAIWNVDEVASAPEAMAQHKVILRMKARVKRWKEARALVSEDHGNNLNHVCPLRDFFSKTEKLLYCLGS